MFVVPPAFWTALAGCGLQAGLVGARSIFRGESGNTALCRSGIACALGAVSGALIGLFPGSGLCMAGTINGPIREMLSADLCDACPGAVPHEDVVCQVSKVLFSAIAMCAIGGLGGKETAGIGASITAQFLAALWGYDSRGICLFFTD